MADTPIPVADLPTATPGDADYIAGSQLGTTSKFRVDQLPVPAALSAPTGAALVGYGSGTVAGALDESLAGVGALRKRQGTAYAGFRTNAVVTLLGDSNAEGVGTGGYSTGYMGLFARAIFNATDFGYGASRGFGYETLTRMNVALGQYGMTSTGSVITGEGASDARLQLEAGESISITGREIASVDVFYDADASTGSIEFLLDGVLYNTKPVSGAGIQNTFPTYALGSNKLIRPTETVTIRASGGTLVVTGVMGVRNASSSGTLVYSHVRQGWGFDDFAAADRVAEVATYANAFYGSGVPRLNIICLGTNNMIDAVGKQKTPADYITALDALIAAYAAVISTSYFAVWVPPRPLETLPLGEYEEYVAAIVEYCAENSIHCIRADQTEVSKFGTGYYSDTRHFNGQGHDLVARALCDSFGIPPKFYIPTKSLNQRNSVEQDAIPLSGLWTAYASSGSAPFCRYLPDGYVVLRGLLSSNGGTTTVGTLPANARPDRTLYVVANGGGSPVCISIAGTGVMTVQGSVPATLALDGVSFCREVR